MSQVVLFASKFNDPGLGKINPYAHTRRGVMPAIYRLATHLRLKGYSVSTIGCWWCDFDLFKEIVRKYIDTNNTKLVGISTTLFSEISSLVKKEETEYLDFDIYRKLEFIKHHSPNTKIIIGGSATEDFSKWSTIQRKPFSKIDMVCRGQGERVIEEILNNIYTGSKLISENIAPSIYSNSTYPFLDFNSSYTEYLKSDFINQSDCLGIEYARGCIFSCSYCDHPMLGKKPNEFIKDKNVLRQEFIRNYETMGTKYYFFTDNLLNENLEKMEALAEAASNLPFKLQYGAYIRLDLIHKFPKMADLLRDSGMIGGSAGIETINSDSGKSVKKGLGLERTNEVIDICYESWRGEVALDGLFMIGLPHDTADTVYELEDWLNTDRVKRTMTNFFAQPLYIVTDGMENQPDKVKYTWSDPTLPKSISWTNKNGFTFNQAKKDASYLSAKFLEKYQMSDIKVNSFNMVQVLAYAEKYGVYEEFRNAALYRIPSDIIKNRTDWDELCLQYYNKRSDEYIKNLLGT